MSDRSDSLNPDHAGAAASPAAPALPPMPEPSRAPTPHTRKGPLLLVLAGLIIAALGFGNLYVRHRDEIAIFWPMIAGMAGVCVVVAVLIATAVVRHRTNQRMAENLRALESLQAVSAAISAQIGQGPQVLQQVTDAARNLLRMSMAAICIVDDTRHATVITASGVDEPIVGRRWPLDELRAVSVCIRENRQVWIPNITSTDKRVHPDAIHRYGTRAFLVMPLEVEGRTLGALAIADRRARRLREDEMRLASLWAAHAAVILHHDALYQRMEAALRHERQVQAHRDLLIDLSTTLYERQPLKTALQRIVDRAPSVLGVDLVCFAYYLEDGAFEFVAATRGFAPDELVGMRFDPGTLRATEVLREGRIVCIEDTSATTGLNPYLLKTLQVGSLMYVPMFGSDGVPRAVMSLARRQRGPFATQHQQIATHLADRVAAAIEAVRLHHRIRDDAETKSMLLRELHHRVKNNLAGIVSLLSINQPELPQPARQWLDRVIDRIGIMARTHELFTGMSESISLGEVIRITLSSLSVVVPPMVRIETDIAAGERTLSPDRAVALAMVLHELAHNAIAHGTRQGGRLLIRCAAAEDEVKVEVIDDGKIDAVETDPVSDRLPEGETSSGSGIGLGLVRGLVTRELQGRFNLENNRSGGTTATVAFSAKQCDAALDGIALMEADVPGASDNRI